MRTQKILLLISLLLVVMYSCKNTNSNDKIEQAKDSIVNIASDDIVLNNPLAGKKFYYLEKDKTNSYDNHMILKACLWTSKRFIQKIKSYTLLGKEYKKSYELLKTDYSPQNLGVFLTEAEYNKYKHLWEEK